MVVELRPHQEKAVDRLRNGNILNGGVGVGKSITALAYYYSKVCKGVYGDLGSMRDPRDLYIITTAKKRDSGDWEAEAGRFVIGRDRESSVGNVQMTVDSWNNIGKYEEVEDAFFIFDEQRLVGSGAWVKSFLKITKSNKWIILSATPGDTWLDYIPVFVANGFYKNRTAFKREHVVYNTYSKFPKVDRYIGVGKLVRYRNQILVDMPYDRHTRRIIKDVYVEHDEELFKKVVKQRWHVFEERPIRDVSELFRVMRKVANSDASRIEAVEEILQRHQKVIVFYNFDYELEMLRTLISSEQPSSTSTRTSTKTSRSESPTMSTRSSPTGSESTTASGTDHQKATSFGPTTTTPTLMKSTETEDGRTSAETLSDPLKSDSSSGSSDVIVAEWNGHKHQPIPDSDRWIYLVQYTAGSEGWNCIETDAMVFFSLTYSYKQFHQAQGRIDRMNTPYTDLFYYVLKSKSWIDIVIWKALSSKRDFNERQYGQFAT